MSPLVDSQDGAVDGARWRVYNGTATLELPSGEVTVEVDRGSVSLLLDRAGVRHLRALCDAAERELASQEKEEARLRDVIADMSGGDS